MAIQNRRGIYADLDKNKLVPGEFAFCTNNGQLYYCYSPGSVKLLATIDELQALLDSSHAAYTALQELIAELESDTNLSTTILNKISELKSYVLETSGYGVVSGLDVTAQSTPNMTVNVNSGITHMPNTDRVEFASPAILTINPADTSNPRIDIIYVSASKVRSYLAGTPASSPTAPNVPSGGQLLYQVSVAANQTSITNANITDKRTMIKSNANLNAVINEIKSNMVQSDSVNDSTKYPSSAVTYVHGQEIDILNSIFGVGDYDTTAFTQHPADWLGPRFFNIKKVTVPSNSQYAPTTNGSWWNVITFGIATRCTQLAFCGYIGMTETQKIYMRTQHDSNVTSWREI